MLNVQALVSLAQKTGRAAAVLRHRLDVAKGFRDIRASLQPWDAHTRTPHLPVCGKAPIDTYFARIRALTLTIDPIPDGSSDSPYVTWHTADQQARKSAVSSGPMSPVGGLHCNYRRHWRFLNNDAVIVHILLNQNPWLQKYRFAWRKPDQLYGEEVGWAHEADV